MAGGVNTGIFGVDITWSECLPIDATASGWRAMYWWRCRGEEVLKAAGCPMTLNLFGSVHYNQEQNKGLKAIEIIRLDNRFGFG